MSIKRYTISQPNPDGYVVEPWNFGLFRKPTEIVLAAEHDAEIERLRNALDWIADPRGNNVCTPQEIAEAALGRAKP